MQQTSQKEQNTQSSKMKEMRLNSDYKEKNFVALYASCQSEAEYAMHRKRSFGESCQNFENYSVNLKSYGYEHPWLIQD